MTNPVIVCYIHYIIPRITSIYTWRVSEAYMQTAYRVIKSGQFLASHSPPQRAGSVKQCLLLGGTCEVAARECIVANLIQ